MPLLSLPQHLFPCRSFSSIIASGLFISSLTWHSSAFADTRLLFNQGADFFQQGNYQQAVERFEQARRQGLKAPSLLYNLASSYYKLKRYGLAEKYFLQLRHYPKMRPLAEYNLALVAEKQQHKAQADRWLKSVIRSSNNAGLLRLAKAKLQKTSAPGLKRYSVYSSLSLGQDSNINIAEVNATSLADSFNQLIVSGNYLLTDNKSSGWFADFSYYQLTYSTQSLFDNSELAYGISKRQKINNWSFKYALQQARSTYGGADYQNTLRLNLYAYYRLDRQRRLNFSYRYNDITSQTTSTALQGSRQNIKAEYRHYSKHTSQKLSYELELNNREDSATSSFSPIRNRIRYQYSYYLDNGWRLAGELGLRQSDYPTVAAESRSDSRIRASISADYRFSKTFKFRSRFSYTDNQSNIATDSYKKQLLTIGLSKLF